MLNIHLLEKAKLGIRDNFSVVYIVFNAFVWWYMTLTVIDLISSHFSLMYIENLLLWATYHCAVLGSSLVGSFLSDKIKRFQLLSSWTILGVIASLLPIFYIDLTMIYLFSTFILFGISFGLGMPSCLAYFSDCTVIEKRGYLSGVIFLCTNLGAFLFLVLSMTLNPQMISIVSAIWRVSALVVLLLLKPEEKFSLKAKKKTSFTQIFHEQTFILYLTAWLMFCFIDQLEIPILKSFFGSEFWNLKNIIGSITSSLSAVIGGLLCDRIGRKRIVIYGFVALGLAYALIGIAPEMQIFWYFYSIIDGAAWGIFMVTFILTIWGDLSQPFAREKYYVVGSAPFFLTDFLRLVLIPYAEMASVYVAFSLAGFFLFLAVLPLMYAPETLPEKKIRLRQLRSYMEKAKKVRKKYLKKS